MFSYTQTEILQSSLKWKELQGFVIQNGRRK